MENIDHELQSIHQQAERILAQGNQEKAMADVLPLRFEVNFSAFEKYIPNIAETFRNYQPQKSYRLFCTENGIPNLEWIDKNVAIYGADPFSECEEQIKNILTYDNLARLDFSLENNPLGFVHIDFLNKLVECNNRASQQLAHITKTPDSVPLLVMFGVGLGYQLGYLYERCRVNNLFLFEPDLDLFYASLFCFDWASLLEYLDKENLGLHIFLGQDEKTVMSDLITVMHSRGAFLISNALLCWHYPSPEIFKLIEQVKKEFYLLAMGWGFYDDNIIALSHCAANLEKKVPFLKNSDELTISWKNVPVFVIANGPSLDSSLETIQKYKNKAILISCGSTISALHRAGIRPDIHVETERTKAVPDFLDLIGDKSYLEDILFLSTDVIHPNCMNYFKRAGLCFKFDEPSAMLCSVYFPEVREFAHLTSTNPLVSNIGLKMACALGFENIYLFGVDNGYKDRSHHHSRLSAYFDDHGEVVEQLTDLVIGNSSYFVPGNFGGQVSTTGMFDSCRRVLGLIAADYPDANISNCSDGAYISDCKPLAPHLLNLDENDSFDKNAIIDNIYRDRFKPIKIDRQSMMSHLDVDFFNEFIDRLITEWDQPFSSRTQVVELMLKQYSYLGVIANSYQRHIYKMLIGTLNYVFSLVGMSLYRYESDKETLNVIRESTLIMQEYFKAAKQMYPKALDSVDEVDNSIMDLFRKPKVSSN